MPLTITKTEFLDKLREVVAERGRNYVDPRAFRGALCRYHNPDSGCGDCMIGVVAFKLGVRYDELKEWSDIGSVNLLRTCNYRRSDARVLVTDSEETFQLMREAQSRQDDGQTYGDVLDGVEELAR